MESQKCLCVCDYAKHIENCTTIGSALQLLCEFILLCVHLLPVSKILITVKSYGIFGLKVAYLSQYCLATGMQTGV